MDKMAERVGLYDIWVIFFPGTVATLELLSFIWLFWAMKYGHTVEEIIDKSIPSTISAWILFILVSIFLGIILQEIGRQLRMKRNYHDATKGLIDSKYGVFSDEEIESFKPYFIKCGWNEKNNMSSRELFNRINSDAQNCDVATKYVKLSVLQNMSISLAASMWVILVESIMIFICGIIYNAIGYMVLAGIAFFAGNNLKYVFFSRAERFNQYWVRNLIYAMYIRNNVGQ